jgi:CheY-like chemotaxis protein
MFSLTKAEAAQIWPELEKLWLEQVKLRACGTPADERTSAERRRDERPTVLVVDDDDDVRGYAAAVLQAVGYTVVAAASPSEALYRLGDASTIDLLFTDIVLPEIDGFKLAELAKRRHPGLRVLYASGYLDVLERQPIERYGRVLAKPYRSAQLEQAVGEATVRHRN